MRGVLLFFRSSSSRYQAPLPVFVPVCAVASDTRRSLSCSCVCPDRATRPVHAAHLVHAARAACPVHAACAACAVHAACAARLVRTARPIYCCSSHRSTSRGGALCIAMLYIFDL
jgi:hypothetical protein